MGDIMFKKFSKKPASQGKENNIDKACSDKVLTKSLEHNISLFEGIFSGDELIIIRRFQNKHLPCAKCCIIYFEGMVNYEVINDNIIQPVLNDDLTEEINKSDLLEELQYKVIVSNNVKVSEDVNKIVDSIIYGDTVFLLEGYDKALVIETKGWKSRDITEPESSRVVRGPREGFTESIIVNLTLIRRIIKCPDLKYKFDEIGERTRTKTCICYIEGVAMDSVLKELEQRLKNIKIDAILDSGYIQELIRDEPFSPFETVGASERPDVIASKLLEGRIALFVDGSPFVLTVPYVLAETTQANEDYYNNYIFSSINRFLRTISAILAIIIPSIFLAITTYHQEMIPTHLLLSIAASREGIPFPTVFSLILMLLVFDILREAGTRMPSSIGQAINIVGTLVLGQAAVEARLVSAPVVIVTALTGILTLMNKNLIGATVILRFLYIILTSILGIYGLIFGFIALIIHFSNIRSFGVPYMLGVTRVKNHDGQDAWIRAPWWTMTLRPKIIGAKNLIRKAGRK